MSVDLSQEDFRELLALLIALPEMQMAADRVTFLDAAFTGAPRGKLIRSKLNVDGAPRIAATRLITTLATFGKLERGKEALGFLLAYLIDMAGADEEAFLRGLFTRYPLDIPPAQAPSLDSTEWQGKESADDVREKIVGENTLQDIYLLQRALTASAAVVHISNPLGLGTGFLVAPDLVMTNHHVIESVADLADTTLLFNYQLGNDKIELPVTMAQGEPSGLFYTDADLDVTVFALRPDDVARVATLGNPLGLKKQTLKVGNRVAIIQHPGGKYKQISFQNNFVQFADARVVQYTTSTLPGSSGSPVFNTDFEVVALHCKGGRLQEPGTPFFYLRNAGTSMAAILSAIQAKNPDLYRRLNRL